MRKNCEKHKNNKIRDDFVDEGYEIRKGRKVGVGTPDSYFTGTITGWNYGGKDIFLGDVEETIYHFLPLSPWELHVV